MSRGRLFWTIVATIGIVVGDGWGQTWLRGTVTFEKLVERAQNLAGKAYVPPSENALPQWMQELSYDQYRDIRFDPKKALWIGEGIPFRAMFFHPGYLFRRPVEMWEFTDSHQQRIRLSEEFFTYGPLIEKHGAVPPEVGFAGVRLHTPLNTPDYYDELIVFQGASYWRALGRGQRYGISARGIAVNTGLAGVPEEFPDFRAFWLRKPNVGDDHALVYALLDGPSVTGAYEFMIYPGEDTVVDVRMVVFLRRDVQRLGIAPMSSMYWFGENSRRRFDDYRPEVHDSDGLAIWTGRDERIWRPAMNDTGRVEFSFYADEGLKGFGLLQRDRRLVAYEDEEACYHLRPSLWIKPVGDWGKGQVMLMEIPTANELADNLVAMWIPDGERKAGERLEFRYKQYWTMREDPSEAGGRVVATRTGLHEWLPGERTMIVEFAGEGLPDPAVESEEDGKKLEAVVEAIGENAGKVVFDGVNIYRMQDGRLRLSFQMKPAQEGGKLEEIGPVELRAALRHGEDYVTETWSYRIEP